MKPLERTTIYQGRIFNVYRDRLEGDVYREIIEHGGSVAILIHDGPTVCLVNQYRHAAGQDLWEIPAGTLAPGEDPYEGAKRECEEELGAIPLAMNQIYEIFPSPGFLSEKLYIFECTEWEDGLQSLDDDENLEVGWFSINEAQEMVYDGTIQDAKTIIAILSL